MALYEKMMLVSDVKLPPSPGGLQVPWLDAAPVRMRRRPVLATILTVGLASILLNVVQSFLASQFRHALGAFHERRQTARQTFTLPEVTAPVAETTESLFLDNHPVSPWRPANQFWTAVPSHAPEPIVGLATIVTEHPDLAALRVSYEALRAQSLQRWHWYLIDSRSQPTILAQHDLRQFSKLDPRITVIRDESATGGVRGRNFALQLFAHDNVPFAAYVAPNDVLELTLLEKAAWTLATVPEWDLVGFFEATFGDMRSVTHDGVHSGVRNINESLVPQGTIFRVAAVDTCRFENGPTDKASFWGFWLCFATRGRWGGSLPELGVWRRETPYTTERRRAGVEFGPSEKFFVQSTYPKLAADVARFPVKEPPKSVSLEPITWQPPFRNDIAAQPGKSIMIIQGWLLVGGSELGFLDILRKFAEAGYRVTMVLTRFKYPDGVALRPRVAQYTHDIHFLPASLRMHDFPRYIKYLIDSRGIDTVFMSNSVLVYEILPSLVEQTPHTRWIDYLHNEAFDGWKHDGFPSLSLASRRYLDRTITCSEHLREFMIERGYPKDRVGVVKLGINVTRFEQVDEDDRALVKAHVLSLSPDVVSIVSSARLDTQKRPWLVPDIIRYVRQRLAQEPVAGVKDVVMFMMGEGPLRGAVEERIHLTETTGNVRLLGTVDEPEQVLRGADLFLLPSAIEGISVAVAEAMAMGVPIVTSMAGGLPEQLGHLKGETAIAGRLIELVDDEHDETRRFGDAVYDLVKDPALRQKLGADAATYVRQTFDQDTTLLGMFEQRKVAAGSPRPSIEDSPNPSAYFGISEMILDDRLLGDMQVVQRRLGEIRKLGPAGELQAQCFVESDAGMRWVDAVAETRICAGSPQDDAPALFKSGREQCGAWCVWDLRTREKHGWQFDGQCFTRFEDPGPTCAGWFHTRPNFDFTSLPPPPSKPDKSPAPADGEEAATALAPATEELRS